MLKDLQCNGFNLYPEAETGNTDPDHSQIVSKVTALPSGLNTYDREENLHRLLVVGRAYEKQLSDCLPHASVDEVLEIHETLSIVRGQNDWTRQRLEEVRHAS